MVELTAAVRALPPLSMEAVGAAARLALPAASRLFQPQVRVPRGR